MTRRYPCASKSTFATVHGALSRRMPDRVRCRASLPRAFWSSGAERRGVLHQTIRSSPADFQKGDPFLDADAVFLPKSSLIVDFVRHDSAEEARAQKTTLPFCTVEFDFGLKPWPGPGARAGPGRPRATPRRPVEETPSLP
jgi:hypothetical protein